MKKKSLIDKILIAFLALIALYVVLFGIWNAMRQTDYEHDTDLPVPLIGTWRRIDDESRVYIFREDGTGLKGGSGHRYPITWYMIDGELRRDVGTWSYVLEDGVLLAENRALRGRSHTYTYVFYSEATDLYEQDEWIMNFIILPALGLTALFLIWRALKKRKYRFKEFIFDTIILAVPLFALFFWGLNFHIISASITAVIFRVLLMKLYSHFILHKLAKNARGELNLIKCEGAVVEKNLLKHPQSLFRREWIVLNTTDGQQIRTYVSADSFDEACGHLNAFDVGDTGTFHYRKGKKYNYFEAFEPKLDDSENYTP